MSVRYFSSERTIQAAGAAFACVDDDMSMRIEPPQGDRRAYAGFMVAALALFFLLI